MEVIQVCVGVIQWCVWKGVIQGLEERGILGCGSDALITMKAVFTHCCITGSVWAWHSMA